MSREDEVRRIQELRRSSAASPVDRTESRSVLRRKAIQEEHLDEELHQIGTDYVDREALAIRDQEYNEDGSCTSRCPYGTCGGGPEACGGCCSCLGGCEMANQPVPEDSREEAP